MHGKARVEPDSAARSRSPRKGRPASSSANDPADDRRAYIIRKAAERIARHGFAVTSVRQIADDVDILSGSLYHHFATKEEILHEIVKDAVGLLRNETLRIADADADPETRFVALILLELGELVENHPVHAILYNERKLFRRSPEFSDVRAAKKVVYGAWRSILGAGMESGQFDTSLDLYQTIRTIMRMLNSAADWYASGDETIAQMVEQYSFEQVKSFYLRFILGAIRDPRRAFAPVPREQAERLVSAR
jgi:AcrR family transcriptional regulator